MTLASYCPLRTRECRSIIVLAIIYDGTEIAADTHILQSGHDNQKADWKQLNNGADVCDEVCKARMIVLDMSRACNVEEI